MIARIKRQLNILCTKVNLKMDVRMVLGIIKIYNLVIMDSFWMILCMVREQWLKLMIMKLFWYRLILIKIWYKDKDIFIR